MPSETGGRVRIQTTRFGPIEVPESTCYAFPEGMLGFPGITRYALFDNPGGGPLKWLQAVDDPSLAFVCCDPSLFLPGYRASVHRQDLKDIALERVEDGYVLVVLVIGKNPSEATANLLGPLVLNVPKRLGKQQVLSESDYSSRHPVFSGSGA